jgi:hypothetical protein
VSFHFRYNDDNCSKSALPTPESPPGEEMRTVVNKKELPGYCKSKYKKNIIVHISLLEEGFGEVILGFEMHNESCNDAEFGFICIWL